MKIAAGLRGHSASVVADGFESAADVFASGLVLVGPDPRRAARR